MKTIEQLFQDYYENQTSTEVKIRGRFSFIIRRRLGEIISIEQYFCEKLLRVISRLGALK